MNKNIVLIGMSGAGKTIISKLLAKELSLKYYDTDAEIENDEVRSISKIFEEDGEDYFRIKETEKIKELSKNNGCIISTGGGVILKNENVEFLKENGIVFYIKRDIDLIINTASFQNRPLFKIGKEYIADLFNKRKALYENYADYIIGNNQEIEDAVNKIIRIYEEVSKRKF